MNKGVPRKSNAQSSESVRDKKEREGRSGKGRGGETGKKTV